MKTVVTGASGFLGHWVVRKLSQLGHEVVCLIRNENQFADLKKLDADKNVSFVLGDVTNSESLMRAFHKADTVFHLAGVIAYRQADRALMDQVNVIGTDNVIKAVQANRVRKLVHISSVCAIGSSFSPNVILNENSEFNLGKYNLGYFETKRISEENVVAATKKGLIDSVILNPSTIYGFGDATKGSRKTQIKVAQGKFPFYTRGGASIIHAEDCVQGILSAWEKGRSGERYILSGENLTIQQIFSMIADCAGQKPPGILFPKPILFTLGAVGDLQTRLGLGQGAFSLENARVATLYHWYDNRKAKKELGLTVRPAIEAIRESVRGMRQMGLIS